MTTASPGQTHRAGTVIIMVSAIAGLLSSLVVVLLMTVRADLDDVDILAREGQARIMLSSACDYIQEASRIGWDFGPPTGSAGQPAQTEFSETYGWVDIRDGELGPRVNTAPYGAAGYSNNTNPPSIHYYSPNQVDLGIHQSPPDYQGAASAYFPIGVARRFPMYVMRQPPYAIQLTTVYNPVQLGAPDNGLSFLTQPDPQPVSDNGWTSGTVTATNFANWAQGDQTPRENSYGMSWFRLVREGSGAVFTVTCGAGATQGYRDWSEVMADGITARQLFSNDPNLFNSLAKDEYRIWYRVEWSPATAVTDMNYLQEQNEFTFILQSHAMSGGGIANSYGSTEMAPNMGGTIQWIQRLPTEPPYW